MYLNEIKAIHYSSSEEKNLARRHSWEETRLWYRTVTDSELCELVFTAHSGGKKGLTMHKL